MADQAFYTREGLTKIQDELHELKTKARQEASRAIAEARDKGDLSENAEYDAAKEAQGLLELKINKLETVVANARILDDSQFDTSKAYILSTVKVRNTKTKAEQKFTLVSAKEADLSTGKISVDSPIGKGLLGKSKGDKVAVNVPAGTLEFQVLEITR
jgi:transcription elongation factor GreA